MRHRHVLKASGALIAVLFAASFLTGCGESGGPPVGSSDTATAPAIGAADRVQEQDIIRGPVPGTEAAGPPVDGGWLIYNLPAEMENLNPFTSQDAYSARLNEAIFDTLLDRDPATLELIPELAESWEIGDDKLTYTFTLREGLRYSDGEPLTVNDVKFSFDTIKDPTVNAPQMRNYFQDVQTCEVLDDRRVKFTCDKPYFKHLSVLGSLEIIPQHIYGTGDFNTHPNNRNPIGSGPYKLERWTTGQEVVLVRNENYWGEKPHILRRVYKIITNDEAAFQVLQRGELDLLGMRPEMWVTRTTDPDFEERFYKLKYYTPSYYYIGWNLRRPQFQDKLVRRALTMLLDRQSILDSIYYGFGRVTTGSFFFEEPEYNKEVQPWPFDPAGAQELLSQQGWVDTDGDGVREKDGVPLRFEFLVVNDSVTAEQIATVYQEELKRAGVDMSIRQLEWATFLESVKKHNFDAATLAWSLSPDPDPYQVWHSSQTVVDGSNSVGFENAEADQIMEAARQEFDRDKRIQMYHRFHEILHEEQPYTFLFVPMALVALDKRFKDVSVYPYGLEPLEWWVPTELQRYK